MNGLCWVFKLWLTPEHLFQTIDAKPEEEASSLEAKPGDEPDNVEPIPTDEPDKVEPIPTDEPDKVEPIPTDEPDKVDTQPGEVPDNIEPKPGDAPDNVEPQPGDETSKEGAANNGKEEVDIHLWFCTLVCRPLWYARPWFLYVTLLDRTLKLSDTYSLIQLSKLNQNSGVLFCNNT